MTPVPSETQKKLTKTQQRNRKRRSRKDRKLHKRSRVVLARRLEKYRRLLAETKAARAKTARHFIRVNIPEKFQAIAQQIVSSAANYKQPSDSPVQINPQLAMSGNCFWLNYQNVFQWKDRCKDSSSSHSVQPALPGTLQAYQEWKVTRSKRTDPPLDDDLYVNGSTAESEYHEAPDTALGGEPRQVEQNGDCESDDDIVVTEEMMQFLEISMRHKANREREKQAAKERERDKKIEERDCIEDCQVPTEEDENEKRLREMSELYGEEAAKIHGMETALQLNFNRQLDLFDPSYWPFYPFSMQFRGVTELK